MGPKSQIWLQKTNPYNINPQIVREGICKNENIKVEGGACHVQLSQEKNKKKHWILSLPQFFHKYQISWVDLKELSMVSRVS